MRFALVITALIALASCMNSGRQSYENPNRTLRALQAYWYDAPDYSSEVFSAAELSALTAARIELGHKLFRDPRLSVQGDVACATCHNPSQAFTQTTRSLPKGAHPMAGGRNAPSLYDVVTRHSLFLDGRSGALADQAAEPLLNPREMGNPSVEALAARVRAMPDYDRFFRLAFGGSADPERIKSALAAYQVTLITGPNRFDRWKYQNRKGALTASEIRGYELFVGKAACADCHRIGETSATFTDGAFHDTGYAATKPPLFARADVGRFAVTGNPSHRFAFRTPSLRNVALTAPYMHDGGLRSLEEVVALFNRTNELRLNSSEQADIIAFLNALTSAKRP